MKYMGSKGRVAKELLEVMLPYWKEGMCWVEPFVGGGNMIDKVPQHIPKIGSDINSYVIAGLKLIRDNPENIPDVITEEDYKEINRICWLKNKKDVTPLEGFVAFAMSFAGKFFGGYRRDVKGAENKQENEVVQTRRAKQSAIKQSKLLQNVKLFCCEYTSLPLAGNCLIYCDPPYELTTGYKDKFDHNLFWEWCRRKSKEGHIVFISEYNAPPDFECIWQKQIGSNLDGKNSKQVLEKLFIAPK